MNDGFPFESSALLTDLYQFTMAQGYLAQGMEERAVFEFFSRKMPESRNFLVAAGLEQVLSYLESFHFEEAELEWLSNAGTFSRTFVDSLRGMRFTGDVDAMPEGTLFFPPEPVLRVTAPIAQAQLVESRIINLLHYPILLASKAARCKLVAPEKLLVEFGMRRAHGGEAALMAARASYLAGFAGTSNVMAGRLFSIPTYGTMAHSFIQAHADEEVAFLNFCRANPQSAVLLIDTYDTEAAARLVASLAPQLQEEEIPLKAVRLDSGDLADHARNVRRILDEAGLDEVKIFASGSLDEYQLQRLLQAGAPIDGFGIGTRLDTATDAPQLDCAYKLQCYGDKPCRKRSEGKATWPGIKQVVRRMGADGRMEGDEIVLADHAERGSALLQPFMRGGKRCESAVGLEQGRARCQASLEALPETLQGLETAAPYPVAIADPIRDLARRLDEASPHGGQGRET